MSKDLTAEKISTAVDKVLIVATMLTGTLATLKSTLELKLPYRIDILLAGMVAITITNLTLKILKSYKGE